MIIAIIAPKIGIKCKKIPALLAPIKSIPFIQKKNEANPGKRTTYIKVKINGFSNLIKFPIFISIKYIGIKKIKPQIITTSSKAICEISYFFFLKEQNKLPKKTLL